MLGGNDYSEISMCSLQYKILIVCHIIIDRFKNVVKYVEPISDSSWPEAINAKFCAVFCCNQQRFQLEEHKDVI